MKASKTPKFTRLQIIILQQAYMHLMRRVDIFKSATAMRVSHACNFNTLRNVANSKLWYILKF